MSAAAYFLLLNAQQCGPYSRAELRHQMSRNWVPSTCLCWHEGLTDWEPIEDVLGRPDPRLSPVPFSREFLGKLQDDLAAEVEAGRKKLLPLVLLFLLVTASSAKAFLGDDKTTLDQEYGQPVRHVSADGENPDLWIYESKGYRVLVGFEKGHSHFESFDRLDHARTWTPEVIQGFLHAHAGGETWREDTSPGPAGVRAWSRPGATAGYVEDEKGAAFEVTAAPAAMGTSAVASAVATPGPVKAIVTIKGNGEKTSDPFVVPNTGGFFVEYETTGEVFSLRVHQLGEKRSVAHADLSSAGKDHTFVPAGPGTYYLSVIAFGFYTITVRQ